MKTHSNHFVSTDLLPGGPEHAKEFLELILNNELDGIIYLQAITDHKGNIFDYIIRYYNPVMMQFFRSVKRIQLQPGMLLFELLPSLKKDLNFYRAEKLLKKQKSINLVQYFSGDGLDHWFQVQITKFIDDGYLLNVSNKTEEYKERIWSDVSIQCSDLLLKNDYWRAALPHILKLLMRATKSSRVNFYFLDQTDSRKSLGFHLTDSWMEGSLNWVQEYFREKIVLDLADPNIQRMYNQLIKKRIFEFHYETATIESNMSDIFFKRLRIKRNVFVPILFKGELIGFFHLENAKGGFYYSREKKILRNLGDNFATAIHRRTVRKEIENSENHYRSLVEKLDATVYKTPLHGAFEFTYVNGKVEELVGYSPEELTSNPEAFLNLIHPEDRETVIETIRNSAYDFEPYDIQFRIQTRSMGIKWISATAIGLEDEIGNKSDYLGYLKDITKQKQKDQEIFDKKKLESIGQFAGGIAHDLNNMLQPAILYLSMLREEVKGNPALQSLATKIHKTEKSINRSKELIRKILDFSRSKPTSPQKCRFVNTLDSVIEEIRATHDLQVEWKNRDTVPIDTQVPLDSASLYQVFQNLLKNAFDCQEMVTQPRVDIVTDFTQDKQIHITLVDYGSGIPEEYIQQVFDPFFTTKRMGEGTGLGLSIVYGIVKNSDGKIKLSNHPNHGLQVEITLPTVEILPKNKD